LNCAVASNSPNLASKRGFRSQTPQAARFISPRRALICQNMRRKIILIVPAALAILIAFGLLLKLLGFA
jgi:hypothetical protein